MLRSIQNSSKRREEGASEAVPKLSLFCGAERNGGIRSVTIKQAGSKEAFRRVDYAYPLALGRASRRYGAARFVIVTAMSASERSMMFYSRVKGETERDLAALGLSRLVVLRPSLLLGERTESRPGERLAIALSRPLGAIMIGPLAKYRAIDSRDVASAMISAARNEGPAHEGLESDEIFALAAAARRQQSE